MSNKKIFFLLAFTGLLGMESCKKSFLDVNNNPNSPTENTITPELIFPAAARSVAQRAASPNFTFLQNWMGYFAPSGDFSIQQAETSYNIDFSFNENLWQNHYNFLFDLRQVEIKATAKKDTVLAGAAMILSAKLWQELVDLYGNIPYSDAFDIAKTSTPKYDKAEVVYASLHAQLDKAISYMKGTAASTFPTVVSAMIKFGAANGSVASQQLNWIKFANTLKLRLLIRASEVSTVPGINTATEISKILANGGVLTSGLTANCNPGFVNETNKQSPFYANYGYTVNGSDGNTATRANKYTVTNMTATNDPRLTRLYTTIGGNVVGCVYGQAVPSNPVGTASSKMGPGTVSSATQDQWILTSVESLFLYAEAVARGWIPGSAATAYQNAVTESFIWLGVPSATTAAATYISGNPTIADYATVAGGTTLAKAKFIAYQKYLAMNSIDPLESYSDLRRLNLYTVMPTGFISANGGRLANNLPNRVLYPQEEYTLNFANVSAQGTINTTTIFTGSKIFWQP